MTVEQIGKAKEIAWILGIGVVVYYGLAIYSSYLDIKISKIQLQDYKKTGKLTS